MIIDFVEVVFTKEGEDLQVRYFRKHDQTLKETVISGFFEMGYEAHERMITFEEGPCSETVDDSEEEFNALAWFENLAQRFIRMGELKNAQRSSASISQKKEILKKIETIDEKIDELAPRLIA